MESQLLAPQVATDDGDYYTANRRTLEFLILAGVLALGTPIAILLGVNHGEKVVREVYSESKNASSPPATPGKGF